MTAQLAAESEAAQRRFQALLKADPRAARLVYDLYNAGLIGGLRALTYVKTADEELGQRATGTRLTLHRKTHLITGELPNGKPRMESVWALKRRKHR